MKDSIRTIAGVVFIATILGSFIYGFIKKRKAEIALESSDSIVAIVTKKTAGRSCSNIFVKYTYKGMLRYNEFQAEPDTFDVSDQILLKVSKKYPEKYIAVIRKLNRPQ